MRPLIFTWPIGLVYWAACAWALVAELRLDYRGTGPDRDDPHDAGSRFAVAFGIPILAIGGIAAAFAAPGLALVGQRWAMLWVGTVLTLAGGLLRRHCMRMLGAHFSPRIRAAAGQPVVRRGAYRWVRHPSYSAGLLIYAGLGLALGNWGSAALIAAGTAALYLHRARFEERALRAALGSAYEEYVARTRRFVPFLF